MKRALSAIGLAAVCVTWTSPCRRTNHWRNGAVEPGGVLMQVDLPTPAGRPMSPKEMHLDRGVSMVKTTLYASFGNLYTVNVDTGEKSELVMIITVP